MNKRILVTVSAMGILALSLSVPAFAQGHDKMMGHDKMRMGDKPEVMQARYGGPSYGGAPALEVTASLVKAGGGAEKFDIGTALVSMVGKDLVNAEVAKLTKQYGKEKVGSWMNVFNFAVKDALRIATEKGVKLPMASLEGKELATSLVMAGLDDRKTFYVEFMLDKAVTNGIHHTVMENIDKKFSADADADYHRITNQAMYDLAQALGAKQVKLASFH